MTSFEIYREDAPVPSVNIVFGKKKRIVLRNINIAKLLQIHEAINIFLEASGGK
jgi:hypothetical protein